MQWTLVKHRGKWAVRLEGGRKFSTGLAAAPENRAAAQREAERFCRQLQADDAKSLEDIVRAYRADMESRTRPAIDPGRVGHAWKNLGGSFGGRAVPASVTRRSCRAYTKRRREEGASDWTIRRELGVLRAACQWRDGEETAAVFELPPQPQAVDRHLTRDEVTALLSAVDPDGGGHERTLHLWIFTHLAIGTLGRKEAILGLRWSQHIDFDKREVWLGFKEGGKGRARLPMTDSLFEALQTAHQLATSDFVVEYGGRQCGDVKKGLRAAYQRAGIEGVKMPAHVLRHTGAVYLAEAGTPLWQIAQMLGHSDSRTTERVYARFSPDGMRAAVSALETGERR